MQIVNRTAVIIKPKQPFVDWLNSIPGEDSKYTLERVQKENLTFLIPDFFGPVESMEYIKKNYEQIFEYELFGWIVTEKLWPKNITWKMFQKWFDVEINSEVFGLVGDEEIEKEEM